MPLLQIPTTQFSTTIRELNWNKVIIFACCWPDSWVDRPRDRNYKILLYIKCQSSFILVSYWLKEDHVTVTKFNCWPHEVCEGIKSINARLLMPAAIKPEVKHVWRKNATFVPMKPSCRKLFFVFSNQWRAKQVSFLDFHAEVTSTLTN